MQKSEFLFNTVFVALVGWFLILPLIHVIEFSSNNHLGLLKTVHDACEQRRFCPDYARMRDECAVAANFDKCIDLKTNGNFLRYVCTNDGKSRLINEINPNIAFCFGTSWLDPASQFLAK